MHVLEVVIILVKMDASAAVKMVVQAYQLVLIIRVITVVAEQIVQVTAVPIVKVNVLVVAINVQLDAPVAQLRVITHVLIHV